MGWGGVSPLRCWRHVSLSLSLPRERDNVNKAGKCVRWFMFTYAAEAHNSSPLLLLPVSLFHFLASGDGCDSL